MKRKGECTLPYSCPARVHPEYFDPWPQETAFLPNHDQSLCCCPFCYWRCLPVSNSHSPSWGHFSVIQVEVGHGGGQQLGREPTWVAIPVPTPAHPSAHGGPRLSCRAPGDWLGYPWEDGADPRGTTQCGNRSTRGQSKSDGEGVMWDEALRSDLGVWSESEWQPALMVRLWLISGLGFAKIPCEMSLLKQATKIWEELDLAQGLYKS